MKLEEAARADAARLFAGAGEVRALARGLDWAKTPLGLTPGWSPALRLMARSIYDSPFPMCLWAGPDYALIYNDPYRRILGAKHPASLGQPGGIVWSEIWNELQPQFDGVRAGGPPLYFEDAPFVMARLEEGGTETAWFDYSLSALRDEDGSVAAILNVTHETTVRLVIQRRLIAEQAALAESETRLRLAVENADVGLWDVDPINDRLTWSDRTRASFGVSSDVPVTIDDFYDGLHPDDRAATTAAFLASADPIRRATYDVEYRTIGKEDGVERWVAAKGRGIFDEAGRCVRLTGTALDITVRKAAEIRRSALAELGNAIRNLHVPADIAFAAAEVLGRTLGSSRVGYAAIDPDAETLHVDRDWTAPGVETLSGVLPLRAYGSFFDDLKRGEFTVINDVRADHRTEGSPADALADKSTLSFVNAPVLEFGRLVAVFFVNHATARNWSEGDLGLIREFAERTRSAVERARGEQALRDSEARLRKLNETLEEQVAKRLAERNVFATLFEITDVMIMAVDLEYVITAINKANADEFERIYGVRPKIGDNMLDLLADSPEEQAQVRAGWARGLSGEEVTFVEDYGDRDRVRPYYEIKFRTLRNEAGEPIGTYQFVTDVTQRLRDQAQLQDAQEALRQSQKMEAMGSLTGGVAHDFNNLLTPIIGSLDMLMRKGVGSERERRLIDGALQSAERAKTLVQRLLAFARRQPLQPTAVDVSRLVAGMTGLIESTLGPTIEVRLNVDPALPAARADPNQLEMALLNLAVNARDAMTMGGNLTITVTHEAVRDGELADISGGRYVRLAVADDGVGMDSATVARAIEPFFSTKGVGKGTGLGLSMVHGLTAQLGGGLIIQSTLGAGTSIALWLPVSDDDADVADEAAAVSEHRSNRGTVLLVDDEELVRMSTADMLTELGFDVVEASSAEEALGMIRKGAIPDLLVTDHLMPGMTGAALAREARRIKPGLPVLIVSGYAEVEGVAPDLPRLTKPFRNAELTAMIATLMQSSQETS